MNIDVPAFGQALTANGDATGYVTVASNAGFYVGCIAFLSNTSLNQRCVITELVSTNQVGVRFIANDLEQQTPQYGSRSNCSAFTTATSARLNQEAQLAKIIPPFTRPLTPV